MNPFDLAGALRLDSRDLRQYAQSLRKLARTLRLPRTPYAQLLERAQANVALVAALTTHAWLCGDCIARRAKVTLVEVTDALGRIGPAMNMEDTVACCDDCGKQTVVHRLASMTAGKVSARAGADAV